MSKIYRSPSSTYYDGRAAINGLSGGRFLNEVIVLVMENKSPDQLTLETSVVHLPYGDRNRTKI